MNNKYILGIIVCILAIFVTFSNCNNVFADDTVDKEDEEVSQEEQAEQVEEVEEIRYKAKVINALNVFLDESSDIKYQEVVIEILTDGEYENNEYSATYSIQILDSAENEKLEDGDIVYAYLDMSNTDEVKFVIEDVDRIPYVLIVFVLFIVVILVVGKRQGLKTVISLVVTLASIIWIFIPMVLNGQSAVLAAVIVSSIVAITTFVLIAGISRKAIVSTISTILGVVLGVAIAFIVSSLGRITGLSDEHSKMLIYLTSDTVFDISGIFFAAIIIGTIGATMDVAMSISSAMDELSSKVKDMGYKDFIKSGLAVGRDVMGTMSNTLILAYVGSSLTIIFIHVINGSDLMTILNSDYIASEIVRSFCSTIGMILTIPITAYIYALSHKLFKNKIKIQSEK